jgi:hypothetical protein
MSILVSTNVIIKIYFVFPINHFDNSVYIGLFIIIDIFYPTGEPISLQSLRCSPLAVVHYSFVGPFLTFAATSARE